MNGVRETFVRLRGDGDALRALVQPGCIRGLPRRELSALRALSHQHALLLSRPFAQRSYLTSPFRLAPAARAERSRPVLRD